MLHFRQKLVEVSLISSVSVPWELRGGGGGMCSSHFLEKRFLQP